MHRAEIGETSHYLHASGYRKMVGGSVAILFHGHRIRASMQLSGARNSWTMTPQPSGLATSVTINPNRIAAAQMMKTARGLAFWSFLDR